MNKFNLRNVVFFNLNLVLVSYTIANCLVPSRLSAGGTTGIAIIFYQLYKFPVAWGFFALNLPLVIAGTFTFGKEYGLKTIYSIFAITVFTDLISRYFLFDFLMNFFSIHQAIGAIIGGILTGISIGIIVAGGGSTGGTTILAQIIEKYLSIKIGTTLNTIDTAIVILSGLFIGWNSAFYTIVSLLLCGVIINMIKYRKGNVIEGDIKRNWNDRKVLRDYK